MPTAVTDRPAKLDPPRRLWPRQEYDRLSSSGLLGRQRLELIEGELIDKMRKKRAHVNSLTLLLAWLVNVFGVRRVNPGAPIDVAPEDNPSNEPRTGSHRFEARPLPFHQRKPAPSRPPIGGRGGRFNARFRPHHESGPLCSSRHRRILGAGHCR